MVRPRKLRRVCCLPGVTYFSPQGVPIEALEEVRLSVDELEAIRLKDLEGLEQEEAAQQMGVSRQTFQRVIEDAHRKVADTLVRGKALSISGGDYQLDLAQLRCGGCGHRWGQMQQGEPDAVCPRCRKRRRLGIAGPNGLPPEAGASDDVE